MKRYAACLSFLALAACAHGPQPPKVVTQIVNVPVAVPCDARAAKRPDFPDTAEAIKAADDARLMALLYAGRMVRDGYIGELETALNACSKP